MSLEEMHAYMRLRGWEIRMQTASSWSSWVYANSMTDSGKPVPYDGSPDLDYEDALYRHGLGEDSDEDNSWSLKYCS